MQAMGERAKQPVHTEVQARAPEVRNRLDVVNGKASEGDVVPMLATADALNKANPAIFLESFKRPIDDSHSITYAKVLHLAGPDAGKVEHVTDVEIAQDTSSFFRNMTPEKIAESTQYLLRRVITDQVADGSIKYATRSDIQAGTAEAGHIVAIKTGQDEYKPAVYFGSGQSMSRVMPVTGPDAGKTIAMNNDAISNSPERNLNPEFRRMIAASEEEDTDSSKSRESTATMEIYLTRSQVENGLQSNLIGLHVAVEIDGKVTEANYIGERSDTRTDKKLYEVAPIDGPSAGKIVTVEITKISENPKEDLADKKQPKLAVKLTPGESIPAEQTAKEADEKKQQEAKNKQQEEEEARRIEQERQAQAQRAREEQQRRGEEQRQQPSMGMGL